MRLQLLFLASACAILGCSQPPTTTATTSQQAAPVTNVHSRGVVRAITREYNAITIEHEAMPEYGMEAMVMEFTVDDGSKLNGINVGDHVSFVLKSGLDISSITVTERATPP